MVKVALFELWGKEGMLHYASQLANSLSATGAVQLTVIVPPGTDVSLLNPEIEVVYHPVIMQVTLLEVLQAPIKLIQIPSLLRKLKAINPDVVHINNVHSWYFFLLPFLKKFPLALTLHDVNPHPGADDTFRKRQEIKLLVNAAKHIFVHGDVLKEQLAQRNPTVPRESVSVIPHGDYEFFSKNKQRWKSTDRVPTLLFFGRIREYKGLAELLKASNILVKKYPKMRLVIAGDGDFGPYEELVGSDLNLTLINRYIPDEEVAELFCDATAVVLPYREASQSGVVAIAAALGTPIVATRVGAITEVLTNRITALLVEPQNPSLLAEAVAEMIDSVELQESISARLTTELLPKLGWDRIAATTIAAYDELLSASSKQDQSSCSA
jgi:glycosyltransferase involved in cell wall biosynthesis